MYANRHVYFLFSFFFSSVLGIAAAVIHINTDNDNTDMNTNFNSRKDGLGGNKTSSSSNLLFEDYTPIAGN